MSKRKRKPNEGRFLYLIFKEVFNSQLVFLSFFVSFFPIVLLLKNDVCHTKVFRAVIFTYKNKFFSRERGGSMIVEFQGKKKVITPY